MRVVVWAAMLALTVSVCGLAASGCAKKPESRDVTMNASKNVPPPASETTEPSPKGESTAPEAKAGKDAAKVDETKKPEQPKAPPAKAGDKVKKPSGLEYEELKVGVGTEATEADTVLVNYKGTLKSNGKEFDSSAKHGGPQTFPLNRVVAGFREGIAGMKEGGKRKLVIPSSMAYGAKGSPPNVPPNADLVFEVELIKVQ